MSQAQQNGSAQVGSSSGGYEAYEVIDLANAELDIPPKNCYRLVVLGWFFPKLRSLLILQEP